MFTTSVHFSLVAGLRRMLLIHIMMFFFPPRWYWVYGELFHELTEEFTLPYNYYEADMLDWNLQSEGLRSLKFVAHVKV
jgi:hypothetical protein